MERIAFSLPKSSKKAILNHNTLLIFHSGFNIPNQRWRGYQTLSALSTHHKYQIKTSLISRWAGKLENLSSISKIEVFADRVKTGSRLWECFNHSTSSLNGVMQIPCEIKIRVEACYFRLHKLIDVQTMTQEHTKDFSKAVQNKPNEEE